MEIRKATTEDLEALFKLKLKLKNQDISIDPYLKPIEEAKEVYKKYLIRDLKKQGTDRITLVAVKNNKIVGCIRGTLARTLHVLNVTFRGTIDNLFVEKEYRGNSAAKKLIEGVISWF